MIVIEQEFKTSSQAGTLQDLLYEKYDVEAELLRKNTGWVVQAKTKKLTPEQATQLNLNFYEIEEPETISTLSPAMQEAQHRYQQSGKGKEAQRKYAQSEKGKEKRRNYLNSDKGKAARARYQKKNAELSKIIKEILPN